MVERIKPKIIFSYSIFTFSRLHQLNLACLQLTTSEIEFNLHFTINFPSNIFVLLLIHLTWAANKLVAQDWKHKKSEKWEKKISSLFFCCLKNFTHCCYFRLNFKVKRKFMYARVCFFHFHSGILCNSENQRVESRYRDFLPPSSMKFIECQKMN